MNLLFVAALQSCTRSVYTITKYLQVSRRLGHRACMFGEPLPELSSLPYSTDVGKFDFAIFVIHVPEDFPALPHLANLLDGIPRQRRLVIDCWGRYNETIRVEHDFNHLEKLDGHQGWEWIDALQGVSDKILQPTLVPRRGDVSSFLFHGFDPLEVARPYRSAKDAARRWRAAGPRIKPYGAVYVGNNWQRWSQVRAFLENSDGLRKKLGPVSLAGWHWDRTPDWVASLGLHAADVDTGLLKRLQVRTRKPIAYTRVKQYLGKGRFCPVFQRPLFNHLRLITNRGFEVFCADAIPMLMLPEDLVESVFGSAARALTPGEDVGAFFEEAVRRPEYYWDAVLETRTHLERYHSFERRFQELLKILAASETGDAVKMAQTASR